VKFGSTLTSQFSKNLQRTLSSHVGPTMTTISRDDAVIFLYGVFHANCARLLQEKHTILKFIKASAQPLFVI
jgi:hypothetical protein